MENNIIKEDIIKMSLRKMEHGEIQQEYIMIEC